MREEICKAISMYSGCARAINDLPEFVLVNALSPLFTDVWPHIKEILAKRANDTEIVELCCDFLHISIKALIGSKIDLGYLF